MRSSSVFTFFFALVAVTPASAQERSFSFALTGGVSSTPEYPGSDSYSLEPDLGVSFDALRWGGLKIGNKSDGVSENGWSLDAAFRVLGSRRASENRELTGLRDIDATVEVGLGVTYHQPNWLAFGELRRGFGGHEGLTGTVGADYIMRPSERLTLNMGPRLHAGNQTYASTYFGVTADEALASNFSDFQADGGLLGAGVEVSASYRLNNTWALDGALAYERLLNDASDSPITQLGSDDQWTVRIGLTRAFTLRF